MKYQLKNKWCYHINREYIVICETNEMWCGFWAKSCNFSDFAFQIWFKYKRYFALVNHWAVKFTDYFEKERKKERKKERNFVVTVIAIVYQQTNTQKVEKKNS